MKEYELRLQIGKVRANDPLYRLRQIIPPKSSPFIPKMTPKCVFLSQAVWSRSTAAYQAVHRTDQEWKGPDGAGQAGLLRSLTGRGRRYSAV